MESSPYFVVFKWMVTDLGLKGNSLNIYAIIYGFSQAKDQEFTGSLQYIADFIGASRKSVLDCLTGLVKAGHLIKRDEYVKGVKYCRYKVAEIRDRNYLVHHATNVTPSGENSSVGGVAENTLMCGKIGEVAGEESLPNIILSNTLSGSTNIDNTITKSKRESANTVLSMFSEICKSLPGIQKLTSERIKHINARLADNTIDDFRKVFEKAEASNFCRGQNDRGWKATFDFLISESGFTKTLEGKYDNKDANGNVSTTAHGVPRKIAYRRYRDVDGSDFDLVVKIDGTIANITKAYDDGRTESFQCKVGSEPAWIK